MQKATPRIAQDRRSQPGATLGPSAAAAVLDPRLDAYSPESAALLLGWRVGLQGDPTTCDTMDFYRAVAPQLGPGARVAEVGVAWGRGVVYLASCFVAVGWRDARVYAVDPWLGPGPPECGHSAMHFSAALGSLAVNVLPYEADIICPIRRASPAAAGAFASGELDLVYIDGCHAYSAVLADIAAWTRTVRAGGLLAGHDFNERFPGVQLAVGEAFGQRVERRGDCWVVRM